MADNTSKANILAKTLFIAGGVILFVVLLIFIFRLIPVAISNLANVGSSVTSSIKNTFTDEKITVSTEEDTVTINTPFTLSFDYQNKTPGEFYVTYECVDGLLFDIQSKEGPKRIICNTPLKIGSNISAISLIPILTKENTFVDATVAIDYRNTDGNILASGSKVLTVQGKEGTNVSSSNSNNSNSNPYEVTGSLSGSTVTTQKIQNTSSGYTPKTTSSYKGSYTYLGTNKDLALTYIAPTNDESTLVIYVYNYGNAKTGPWDFSYTDAENPSRSILSPVQASLAPGQGLAVTVRFDGQENSRQNISVVVDPYNKISEKNESNNSGSTTIIGDSGSYKRYSSSNNNDDADLVIKTMEVGRMSGNNFVEDSEINEDQTAAVRLVIKNQGDEPSGSWRFEITDTPDNEDYESRVYSSLRAGASTEIVVKFYDIEDGRYTLRAKVDSDNDVDEENESNNTSTKTLKVER